MVLTLEMQAAAVSRGGWKNADHYKGANRTNLGKEENIPSSSQAKRCPPLPLFGGSTVPCSFFVNLKPRSRGEGVIQSTFSFPKATMTFVRKAPCGAQWAALWPALPSTSAAVGRSGSAPASSTDKPGTAGPRRGQRHARPPQMCFLCLSTQEKELSVKLSGSVRNYVVWEENLRKPFWCRRHCDMGFSGENSTFPLRKALSTVRQECWRHHLIQLTPCPKGESQGVGIGVGDDSKRKKTKFKSLNPLFLADWWPNGSGFLAFQVQVHCLPSGVHGEMGSLCWSKPPVFWEFPIQLWRKGSRPYGDSGQRQGTRTPLSTQHEKKVKTAQDKK